MSTILIAIGKLVWRLTPFLAVRKVYLTLFTNAVRGKKTRRVIESMTFDLDLSETIDVSVMLGQFERDVVAAIEAHCKPGFRVLDIGANVGAHTLRFAKCVGPSGLVYAFEPTIYAYERLTRNVSLNPDLSIRTYRIALSNRNERDGLVDFRASWQTDGTIASGECRADFVRLDDWCRDNGVGDIDMIKIDVDGNEFPVFDGGRQVVARSRPIIVMEVGPYHFTDPASNPVAMLADLGYSFFNTKAPGKHQSVDEIKRAVEALDPDTSSSINVLALPISE
jgi:FkbM family methyltransferase